jgi:hypothetical protein
MNAAHPAGTLEEATYDLLSYLLVVWLLYLLFMEVISGRQDNSIPVYGYWLNVGTSEDSHGGGLLDLSRRFINNPLPI